MTSSTTPDHAVTTATDPPDPTDRERGGGAVSVPMAVLLIAMVLAVGLAIDGVRAAQNLATADAIAEEAARAAGQHLDVIALRRGEARVDPAAAVAAGSSYLAAAGVTGTVTVTGPQQIHVEVELTRPTVVLGLLGRDVLVSTGRADAQVVDVPPGGTP